jgi:hypothetical protein
MAHHEIHIECPLQQNDSDERRGCGGCAHDIGVVAHADDFAGQASVIDGDTLELHGTRRDGGGLEDPLIRRLDDAGIIGQECVLVRRSPVCR